VAFFEYSQNNSGGGFTFDPAGVSHYVIIEADSPEEANDKAERIGLYFDGQGDCDCCGYRWSECWDGDKGEKVPSIYGTPISDYDFNFRWMHSDEPEAFVHFADGTVQGYGFDTKILK
jgi:hypothetical protein